MPNRKILIITYYWPPSGGVGVQRWLHFAKNLSEMGWEPIIYTPENPQFDVRDESLIAQTEGIKVLKSPIWEPFNFFHKITGNKNRKNVKQGLVLEKNTKSWKDDLIIWLRGNLFVPDPRKYWVKPSVKRLTKEVKEQAITHIITTGPPHSMHLIGFGLKRKIPELKWIVDFRDPWTDWDILPKLKVGETAMSQHRALEKKVLDSADMVVTVSKRLGEQFQRKTDTRVSVINNGLSDERVAMSASTDTIRQTFTIGYFGMLNELRDPESFWQALEELYTENQDFAKRLKLKIGGIVSDYIVRKLEHSSFANQVEFLGYLSHEEVFKAYAECDLLLLLLNKSDNAKWILPMKFFEYLSVGKPILSLGPKDSDLADLFEDREIGKMLSGNDVNEIKKFLMDVMNGKVTINQGHVQELLHTFSRKSQTKELGKLLDQL